MAASLAALRDKQAAVAVRQRALKRLRAWVEAGPGRDAPGGEQDVAVARREDAAIAAELRDTERENEDRIAQRRADTPPSERAWLAGLKRACPLEQRGE